MITKVTFNPKTDEVTGRNYERISPEGLLSHYPYYYLKMIDEATNRMLMIIKENNHRNLHLLNLENGEIEQLTFFGTEDKFDDFGPQFTKNGRAVIYKINNSVINHDIESGEVRELYVPKEGWDTYSVPDLSYDDRYLLTVDFPIKDYVNIDNRNWSAFDEQSKSGLRSQLIKINLDTGKKEILIDSAHYGKYGLKKNQWLGHPQFKPGSSDIGSYCHEGRGGTVDARIWLYNHKTKSITCPRPHEYPGEIISHEFFTGDGSAIGFIRIENADSDLGSLRFVNTESYEETNIIDIPRCSHFLTNSTDEYIIADADYPAEPYIHLIDIAKKKDIRLVKHNSSMKSYGNTQDTHPHPLFSPDSKYIFFVSDMEGYPAVYRCCVSDLVKNR